MSEVEGVHSRARGRRAALQERSFPAALGWTIVGAVVPGTGYIAAGRRRLGAFVLLLLGLLLALGIGTLVAERNVTLFLAELASRPTLLLVVGVGALVVAALWIVVIVTGHRMLLPSRTPAWQQAVGGLVALILCAGIAFPSGVASRYSFTTYDLVTSIFKNGDEVAASPGSTQTPINRADPWAGRPRINLLLLGGDSGPGREGMRTDTMIEASIDTHTGATVLFSLPRNLQYAPFPEDNPLHDIWPNGYKGGSGSSALLLNGVYREAEEFHRDLFPDDPNPGLTTLRGVIGEITGLPVDYYVLVNLEGFEQLVDALGGVTIDVGPADVPIGGLDAEGKPQPRWKIEEWIPSGIQHLNGYQALWFARDRWTPPANDYLRMRRQRCLLNAIVDEANPANVLTNYMDIASAAKDNITTDVPYQLFPAFVELGDLVKSQPIRTLPFTDEVITTANPDFQLIRKLVRQALEVPSSTTPPPSTSPPTSTSPPPTSPGETPTETPTPDPTVAVVANDVCG